LSERSGGKRNRREPDIVCWKFSHLSRIQPFNSATLHELATAFTLSIHVCESVLSRVRKVNRSILHGLYTFILPLIHLRKLTCCNPVVIQKRTLSSYITIRSVIVCLKRWIKILKWSRRKFWDLSWRAIQNFNSYNTMWKNSILSVQTKYFEFDHYFIYLKWFKKSIKIYEYILWINVCTLF